MADATRKPRRSRAADPDAPAPKALDAQYRALEESLRDYLERLFEGRGGGPPRGGAAAAGPRSGGWREWRPEFYLAIALAAAAWAGWGGGEGVGTVSGPDWLLVVAGLLAAAALFLGGSLWEAGRTAAPGGEAEGGRLSASVRARPWRAGAALGGLALALAAGAAWHFGWLAGGEETASDPSSPRQELVRPPLPETDRPPASTFSDEPPVPDDPAAAWADLLATRGDEVAGWLGGIASREGLTSAQVSDMQAGRFGEFAATLRRGDELPDTVVPGVRQGLFEYVYALWEGERAAGSRGARVTLAFAGYDRDLLAALLRELGLAAHLAPPYDPGDPALQVAVVRRWLDLHEPPASP